MPRPPFSLILSGLTLILCVRSGLPQDDRKEVAVCDIARNMKECERLPDLTIQDLGVLRYPEHAMEAIESCLSTGLADLSDITDIDALKVDLIIVMALSKTCRIAPIPDIIQGHLQSALEKLLRAPHVFSFLNCAVLKRWLSVEPEDTVETLGRLLGGLAPFSMSQVLRVVPGTLCQGQLTSVLGGVLTSDAVTAALSRSPTDCPTKSVVGGGRCTWLDEPARRAPGGRRQGHTPDRPSPTPNGRLTRGSGVGHRLGCADAQGEGPCVVDGQCRRLLCDSIADTADFCKLHKSGCRIPNERPIDHVQACSTSSSCLPGHKLREAAERISLDVPLTNDQLTDYVCCLPYLSNTDLRKIPSESLCGLNTESCPLSLKHWFVTRAGNCSCGQLGHFVALMVPRCQDTEIKSVRIHPVETNAIVALGSSRHPKLLRKIFKNIDEPLSTMVCNNHLMRVLSSKDFDVTNPEEVFKELCQCLTPPDRTTIILIMYKMGDALKRPLLDMCPGIMLVAIPEFLLDDISTPEDAETVCNVFRKIPDSLKILYKRERLRKRLEDVRIDIPACDILKQLPNTETISTESPLVPESKEGVPVGPNGDEESSDGDVGVGGKRMDKERQERVLTRIRQMSLSGRVELCRRELDVVRSLGRDMMERTRRKAATDTCDLIGFYRDLNVSLTNLITSEDLEKLNAQELYRCASTFSLGLEEWDLPSSKIILRNINEALSVSHVMELSAVDVHVIGLASRALPAEELGQLRRLEEATYSLFGSSSLWIPAQLRALAENWLRHSGKKPSQLTTDDILVLQHIICGFTSGQVKDIPTKAIREAARVLGQLRRCQGPVLEALATHYKRPGGFGPSAKWGEPEFSEIGIVLAGLSAEELQQLGPPVVEYLTYDIIRQLSNNKFEGLSEEQASLLTPEQRDQATDPHNCVGSMCKRDKGSSTTAQLNTILFVTAVFITLFTKS